MKTVSLSVAADSIQRQVLYRRYLDGPVFWLSNTVLGLILRAFFNYLTRDGSFALARGAGGRAADRLCAPGVGMRWRRPFSPTSPFATAACR